MSLYAVNTINLYIGVVLSTESKNRSWFHIREDSGIADRLMLYSTDALWIVQQCAGIAQGVFFVRVVSYMLLQGKVLVMLVEPLEGLKLQPTINVASQIGLAVTTRLIYINKDLGSNPVSVVAVTPG
jgi:hypothetical protein